MTLRKDVLKCRMTKGRAVGYVWECFFFALRAATAASEAFLRAGGIASIAACLAGGARGLAGHVLGGSGRALGAGGASGLQRPLPRAGAAFDMVALGRR